MSHMMKSESIFRSTQGVHLIGYVHNCKRIFIGNGAPSTNFLPDPVFVGPKPS